MRIELAAAHCYVCAPPTAEVRLTSTLTQQACQACEGGVPPLSASERDRLMGEIASHWQLNDDGSAISARFSFRNYHEVMAFTNAVAFIAHRDNHHPDTQLSYRACEIRWTTHAVGGLTLNDFICAAKVDALLADAPPSPNP